MTAPKSLSRIRTEKHLRSIKRYIGETPLAILTYHFGLVMGFVASLVLAALFAGSPCPEPMRGQRILRHL